MKGVLKNKTQIEEWICDKARDRRKRNNELQPFDYPYDLGRKKNFSQVCIIRTCTCIMMYVDFR